MLGVRLFSVQLLTSFVLLCSVPVWAQTDGDGGSTAPAPATGVAGLSTDQAVINQGKSLFEANCKQCHAVHERVVGPALANVYQRRSVDWLVKFIKYPQRVIESGDAYAVALYKEYQQFMPNHDFLKDDEIKAILSWVQAETIKGPATAAATATTTTTSTATPVADNSGLFIIIIAGLSFLLIVT